MAKKRKTGGGPEQAMRQAALRCPDVEEGIACKGTAVECSAFKARKKTFLFVRAEDARVKLHESLVEAGKLAAKEPGRYEAGSLGWVKVKFGPGEVRPNELLEKWVEESYRVVVGPR